MKILVCDDDQKALNRITTLLDEPCQKIRAELTATDHPEELKDLSGFELAFLDIDMNGVNGLTLARQLRAARPDAVIVFVTNFIQYAPEGYEVQAFRYLLKSSLEEKLPSCFLLAVEEIKRRRQSIVVRSDGMMVELQLQDVLYFESNQRIITAFRSSSGKEICHFYASLTELTQQLRDAGFLRIQRSYLVNMAYIQQFQYGTVELNHGIRLPVSAKHYAQHKQQYLLWKGQTAWRLF